LFLFTTGIVVTMSAPAGAQEAEKSVNISYRNIKIYADTNLVNTSKDNEPFILNGTTYLPVRAVGEALGKTVEWDGATQSVYIGGKPAANQYMTDIVPAYQSGQYEHCYKEYSAYSSGGTESFSMGGVKYTNGMIFDLYNSYESWGVYNLNSKYNSINCIIGHVDDSSLQQFQNEWRKEKIFYSIFLNAVGV